MFDFDLQNQVVFIIKIIATVGSAVVGWFVSDPLTRLTYRLSFRAATPFAVLFTGKTAGAALLACAVWFLMPTGGGGSGFGFGPGQGGAPGQGAGKGGSKTADADNSKTGKDKSEPNKSPQNLEPVEIEIIGANDYEKLKAEGKEHWYVIEKKTYSLADLEDYLKANRTKIEVIPVLRKDSIQFGREQLATTGATSASGETTPLTKKYNVKTLQWVTR